MHKNSAVSKRLKLGAASLDELIFDIIVLTQKPAKFLLIMFVLVMVIMRQQWCSFGCLLNVLTVSVKRLVSNIKGS